MYFIQNILVAFLCFLFLHKSIFLKRLANVKIRDQVQICACNKNETTAVVSAVKSRLVIDRVMPSHMYVQPGLLQRLRSVWEQEVWDHVTHLMMHTHAHTISFFSKTSICHRYVTE